MLPLRVCAVLVYVNAPDDTAAVSGRYVSAIDDTTAVSGWDVSATDVSATDVSATDFSATDDSAAVRTMDVGAMEVSACLGLELFTIFGCGTFSKYLLPWLLGLNSFIAINVSHPN